MLRGCDDRRGRPGPAQRARGVRRARAAAPSRAVRPGRAGRQVHRRPDGHDQPDHRPSAAPGGDVRLRGRRVLPRGRDVPHRGRGAAPDPALRRERRPALPRQPVHDRRDRRHPLLRLASPHHARRRDDRDAVRVRRGAAPGGRPRCSRPSARSPRGSSTCSSSSSRPGGWPRRTSGSRRSPARSATTSRTRSRRSGCRWSWRARRSGRTATRRCSPCSSGPSAERTG